MNKKEICLFVGVASGDDERPVRVQLTTAEGKVIDAGIWSVELAQGEPIHLLATEMKPEVVETPPRIFTQSIKPVPSSPYVGPNGEFYPLGNEPIH